MRASTCSGSQRMNSLRLLYRLRAGVVDSSQFGLWCAAKTSRFVAAPHVNVDVVFVPGATFHVFTVLDHVREPVGFGGTYLNRPWLWYLVRTISTSWHATNTAPKSSWKKIVYEKGRKAPSAKCDVSLAANRAEQSRAEHVERKWKGALLSTRVATCTRATSITRKNTS